MAENIAKSTGMYCKHSLVLEGRVAATLREYIKLNQMEDQFGEVLVPRRSRRKCRWQTSCAAKIFPGYVLVQMKMNDYTWQLVRSVPSSNGIYRWHSDKPAPLVIVKLTLF